ncbi:MAG: ABC transporter ATP-binding protein [Pseudomonadota bacterium]
MSDDARQAAQTTLALSGVSRAFGKGATRLSILSGVNLQIASGEIVGLVGPSGSGKSSLLHIAGLLERPTEGDVWIAGRDCSKASDAVRTRIRRDVVGFVYQAHHLLPEFSAEMNVALPGLIAGARRGAALKRAHELLGRLGLAERATHQPSELSGGEQQRVAIARAFANRPQLLLADEPTGNLDPATSGAVFEAFLEAVREEGAAALIATHDRNLAAKMDRTLAIEGRSLIQI